MSTPDTPADPPRSSRVLRLWRSLVVAPTVVWGLVAYSVLATRPSWHDAGMLAALWGLTALVSAAAAFAVDATTQTGSWARGVGVGVGAFVLTALVLSLVAQPIPEDQQLTPADLDAAIQTMAPAAGERSPQDPPPDPISRGMRPLLLLPVAATLALNLGCGPNLAELDPPTPLADLEAASWAALQAQPVTVTGRVVDADGQPVAGAEITLEAQATTTAADGTWRLDDVPRRNAVLRIDADGHHPSVRGVPLVVPGRQHRVDLPVVPLDPRLPATTRALYTGDMAFGRRYMDPGELAARDEIPEDDDEALIRASTAAEDTIAVVDGMVPFFEAADHRVVNLESPVTDRPDTPHLTKPYAYFTLPGSLEALHHLGVDVVGLGNNHVYDYLEQGMVDTERFLDAAGLPHVGAGVDSEDAFQPLRVELGGEAWSYVAGTSVAGVGVSKPLYVAGPDKGGAADLRDADATRAAIGREVDAGRHVIALVHAGKEYSRVPSDYIRSRFDLVIDSGADVVVAHHPHTVQGFERIDDIFVVHSLGNFVFDQDRLETLAGYTTALDLSGGDVVRARVQPHLIDDYQTHAAVGDLADHVVRRASEVSTGLSVVPWAGQGLIVEDPDDLVAATRTVDVTPVVVAGTAYLDLRAVRRPGERLARVEASGTWHAGIDLLQFGAFEDLDVDGDWLESARWYRGETAGPCVTGARTGAGGMCLFRWGTHTEEAVVAFRNRTRVTGDAEDTPNKDLTLMGWWRGDNAGAARVYTRFYASFGDAEFGSDTVVRHDPGTWGWAPFAAPIPLPEDDPNATDPWADNARAVRVFLGHRPPEIGEGRVAMDDLAVVNWISGPFDGSGDDAAIDDDADFVRLDNPPARAVRVTLTRDLPRAVASWVTAN